MSSTFPGHRPYTDFPGIVSFPPTLLLSSPTIRPWPPGTFLKLSKTHGFLWTQISLSSYTVRESKNFLVRSMVLLWNDIPCSHLLSPDHFSDWDTRSTLDYHWPGPSSTLPPFCTSLSYTLNFHVDIKNDDHTYTPHSLSLPSFTECPRPGLVNPLATTVNDFSFVAPV